MKKLNAPGPKRPKSCGPKEEAEAVYVFFEKDEVLLKCTWGKRRGTQSDNPTNPFAFVFFLFHYGKETPIHFYLGKEEKATISSCIRLHYYYLPLKRFFISQG